MADNKSKKATVIRRNVIESLKDIGGDFGAQGTDLLKNTSEDFFKELMGLPRRDIKRTGELKAGESFEMSAVLSGKEEETKKLRVQISLERNMAQEEKQLSERKMQELRVQLQVLAGEIEKMAANTASLANQAEIAMIEAPINPGVYHVIFFEKLIELLHSFNKKINEAVTWLTSTNKRADKKNYWNMYKKKGSSFLLSPDHYLQRSAG